MKISRRELPKMTRTNDVNVVTSVRAPARAELVAAENAYLVRTRYWTDVFHKTPPLQLKTKAS